MDCDDVVLLVAVSEGRTLSGVEERELQAHVAGCAACQALESTYTAEEALPVTDDRLHWVARIPADALDDRDLLVLPTVNPTMFEIDAELATRRHGPDPRARDRRLGRDVAIKEMLDPLLRARFEREAMITARLQHPAIVPIYEAGNVARRLGVLHHAPGRRRHARGRDREGPRRSRIGSRCCRTSSR